MSNKKSPARDAESLSPDNKSQELLDGASSNA